MVGSHDRPAAVAPSMYAGFAGSVGRCPDAIALEVGGERLTYRELSVAAERLAVRIAAKVDQRAVVGLIADQSLATYLGYLAILRLGCVVVPIAGSWPATRVEQVLGAVRPGLVVGPPGAEVAGTGFLPVDPAGSRPADDSPAGPPDRVVDPADLAYILFTSGSTGVPKGVPIRHRNVVAYLEHVAARYRLGPGDRTTQLFDLTFDLSVFDLFATWSAGATLVVPSRAEQRNPVAFVTGRRITHWFSVPSAVSVAAGLGLLPPDSMPGLRMSLFCGEQLTTNQARTWRAAAPATVIENVYGPTELTLSCTEYRLDPAGDPDTANGTVPIGSVYPGHEYLLVDETGRPGPIGELCVRGPQRFDGYWDPAANDGRFVELRDGRAVVMSGPGPVRPQWWYRTGDQVELLDGVLVHHGRLDDQVKVQGHRVEPGEIEAAIRRRPGIVDSVVVAVPGAGGMVELRAAYTGDRQDPRALLRALRQELPRYMVPSTITHFDHLPLNVNRKTDRRVVAERLTG